MPWLDITDEEYFALDAYGSTDLKKSLKSIKHMLTKQEPTKELDFGSWFHGAILEPDKWLPRFTFEPPFDKRKKDEKEAYENWKASLPPDAICLSQKDYETIFAMVESARSHGIVSKILSNGTPERPALLHYRDGLNLRIKPDWMRFDGILVDFKTCKSAHASDFMWDIRRYMYHLQAALYLDVANLIDMSGRFHTWLWVAVEKEPPYEICVHHMDEDTWKLGRHWYEKAIDIILDYKKTGIIKGYEQIIKTIRLPEYDYGVLNGT